MNRGIVFRLLFVWITLALTCVSRADNTPKDDHSNCPMPILTHERLASGRAMIQSATYLDVLILEHCGKVVLEHYANGYTSTRLHDMQSATKSIPGLLVGIAIDRGLIRSVDQPVRELLTEHRRFLIGDKADITVRHLLGMTSGLKWVDFGPGQFE